MHFEDQTPTAERVREVVECPRCGAALGKPCEHEGRGANHEERVRAARRVLAGRRMAKR